MNTLILKLRGRTDDVVPVKKVGGLQASGVLWRSAGVLWRKTLPFFKDIQEHLIII